MCLFNFLCHGNQLKLNMMAHTKQMPRNPKVDRPATVIGSNVQPEGRITSKHKSGKLPVKGGKQPQKHLLHKLIR